ncbi:MAG: CpaF family protein, partial [Acidobacteriota bacterium]
SISEVLGVHDDQVEMQDIFEFERTGISARGRVTGRFHATGVKPVSMDRLKAYGIHLSQSIFQETHELKER